MNNNHCYSHLALSLLVPIATLQANEYATYESYSSTLKTRYAMEYKVVSGSFNLDLDRMKSMLDCDFIPLPENITDEDEILQWMLAQV